ncbi:MAG: hypothetical protein M5U26_04780 [Planctomycetota bacterium]|nr:hypothetical protein [Planctomycetota bacterium]
MRNPTFWSLALLAAFAGASASPAGEDENLKQYQRVAGLKLAEGHALQVEYYPNSDRAKVLTPVNAEGKPDGLQVHKIQWGWTVERKVTFRNGLRDGVEQVFETATLDGKQVTYLASEIPWREDVVQGVKKNFHPDGKLKDEVPMKDGRPEGLSKSFDAAGRPTRVTTYAGGKREGPLTDYWPGADTPKRVVTYAQGRAEGVAREYARDGKLAREIECRAGAYHGVEKLYAPDGSVEKTRYWLHDEKVAKDVFDAKFKAE